MISLILAVTIHLGSITRTAMLHAGDVAIRVVFPPLESKSGAVSLAAGPSVPSHLVVLGNDERLAFHDTSILAYISLRPSSDMRLRGSVTVAFTLPPTNIIDGALYRLSARLPNAESWISAGSQKLVPGRRGMASVIFVIKELPAKLYGGGTYSFVLYRTADSRQPGLG